MKISQAVGMGFLIMGAIGYLIKLSTYCSASTDTAEANAYTVHIPVNNVLVG